MIFVTIGQIPMPIKDICHQLLTLIDIDLTSLPRFLWASSIFIELARDNTEQFNALISNQKTY